MREAVKKGEEARAKGSAATEYDAEFEKAEAEERELSKQIDRRQRLDALEKEAAANHLEDLDKRGIPAGGGDKVKALEYRDAYRVWFTQEIGRAHV